MDDEALLARYKRLDPFNRRVFIEYLRKQRLQNISEQTSLTKLWKVYTFLLWYNFRPVCTAKPQDTEDFYLYRRSKKSPHTAFGDLQELRTFFKWLLPGREVITFHPQRPKSNVDPEKIMNAGDARGLLGVCNNQRDTALVQIFWETGGRLKEILGANVGDVEFDRYGAIISVIGKGGKRRPIRLVNSVPDLQLWLNRYHPLKSDRAAPLFVTSRRRGTEKYSRLKSRTVQNLFKRLKDLSGCQKDTNPHAFRHGRATSRASKLTEPEMRAVFGWEPGSRMPATYVHLSARDIDDKILAIEGVKKEDAPAHDPMNVVACPRCGRPNSPDAAFCGVCYMALTEEGAQVISRMENARNDPDTLMEYAQWLKKRQAV